jgi:hypothetical protein
MHGLQAHARMPDARDPLTGKGKKSGNRDIINCSKQFFS